ncbi:hypothetical protein HOY80DRAFT_993511 [Tuber brumale]|nr:hypothetical protein HOY80DRAFT_993511 [Tuber brumale]
MLVKLSNPSPPTRSAGGFANPPIGGDPGTSTVHNPRTMLWFSSGPTDDTNRTDYCSFLQRYGCPGYLQRLMDEPFKKKKKP